MSGLSSRMDGFRRCLGDGGVEEHAPVAVDQVPIALSLAPESADQVGELLRELRSVGTSVLVRGGGSRLHLGNPPEGVEGFLSTRCLSGVEELSAEDGVVRVGAGTRLSLLREEVVAAGWELPLDAPGPGTTVGGVLAAAASGPRAQGYRAPRDVVLGLSAVLGTGELTHCGGRVVKNVTGYDLAKLYVGSLGTLVVITSAWLRLVARPERVAVLCAEGLAPERACEAAVLASRLASSRAALAEVPPAGPASLVAELAGNAATVDRDAGTLWDAVGAAAVSVDALDGPRRALLGSRDERHLELRVPILASSAASAVATLREHGAHCIVQPGLATLRASIPLPEERRTPESCAAIFQAAARAAAPAGGESLLERAPAQIKRSRDVFAAEPGALAIMRAVKQRFDPDGVLGRGRMAGGL